MIDRELVTRKLALILKDLDALIPIAAAPIADYLDNPTSEVVAERYLERMIGRMIDVNYHLITALGQPPPPDYYESFTRLVGLGILPGAFAAQIAASAGLRNRIVHEYDEIDPVRIHAAAQTAVRDLPEYLRHVQQFLARESGG